MTTFLQNMKDPNSEQQKQMEQVLLGGRGQQKRLHSVDDKIYGTEEAAKLQQEAKQKAKKGKRRRKIKKGSDGAAADLENEQQSNRVKQTAVAVAVVGAVAAGVTTIFLGGKRSQ